MIELAAIASFDEAARLDRTALQALLDGGRPEQRVWAIWALAMRSHDDGHALGHRAAREPDPGVRRTLAVLLAGHGEAELLLGLARHDPELVVRESAIQLATRLAAGGGLDVAIILDAARREPALQPAILGAIGRGAPEPLVVLAHRLLEVGAPPVELEAFEALLRIDTPATRDAARRWMVDQRDVAMICDRWLRANTVESLADAFAGESEHRRGQVLEQLRHPPWVAVERLLGPYDSPLWRRVVVRLDIAIPARVLAERIVRGEHAGCVERLTALLVSVGDGPRLLADLRRAIEADHDEAQLRELAARARRYVAAREITNAAASLDELANAHPVEHLIGLENALARWLAELGTPSELAAELGTLYRYAQQHRDRNIAARPWRQLEQLQLPGGPQLPLHEVVARPFDAASRFAELVEALDRLHG
ncbi:MAG TPA: HEAT repeat domain-containing protein [Kofleriaceae bacterium]|nr:HEAT repeat domain-containing protein [Kofleriaceae bacterium]